MVWWLCRAGLVTTAQKLKKELELAVKGVQATSSGREYTSPAGSFFTTTPLRSDRLAFVYDGFDPLTQGVKITPDAIDESAVAKAVAVNLSAKRVWLTRDPRMCPVAREWIEQLDAPMRVSVQGAPLLLASSLMIFSHKASLAEWGSAYEQHYSSALRACAGVSPRPEAK